MGPFSFEKRWPRARQIFWNQTSYRAASDDSRLSRASQRRKPVSTGSSFSAVDRTNFRNSRAGIEQPPLCIYSMSCAVDLEWSQFDRAITEGSGLPVETAMRQN